MTTPHATLFLFLIALIQPYALALCLLSIFAIFIVELIAFRWGTSKLSKVGKTHGELLLIRRSFSLTYWKKDAHGHSLGSHAAHGPEGVINPPTRIESKTLDDVESAGSNPSQHEHNHGFEDSMATQMIGIAILEFGVVLHR
jgi:zinc transporter 1/2/3